MSNALTVYERMNEMTSAANALHASGFFSDVKTQAQAMVKVMAGAEIGLPPFAAMSGIHIVQGKPVLGANLIATLVKNDPRYDYRVKTADNSQCVLAWYEGGKVAGESSFTMAEANAAGLTGKDNWRKYPSDMLFARALTRGARRYAPGIFGGAPVYTPDEMGVDTDEEGHIIEGQIVTVEQPQAQPQRQAPPPAPATNGNGNGGDIDPLAAAILALPNSDLAFSSTAGATRFIAALTKDAPRVDNAILEAADRAIASKADGATVKAAADAAIQWYKTAAQQQPAQADWLDGDDDAARSAALATAQGNL